MKNMMKSLVLLLATLPLAKQSFAVGRDVRSSDADRKRIEAERDQAAKDAKPHTADARSANVVMTEVNKLALVRMSPEQSKAFEAKLSADADLAGRLQKAIDNLKNPELKELAQAQIEGIQNSFAVDRTKTPQVIGQAAEDEKLTQSYATLAIEVASAAQSWKGRSKEISTKLLVVANGYIAQNKTPAEAMKLAAAEVQQDVNNKKPAGAPDWKINLDDIFKFCKKI